MHGTALANLRSSQVAYDRFELIEQLRGGGDVGDPELFSHPLELVDHLLRASEHQRGRPGRDPLITYRLETALQPGMRRQNNGMNECPALAVGMVEIQAVAIRTITGVCMRRVERYD